MDLFSVVKLAKPTQVTVGVRPLREGEQPILEATAGRLLELAQEESSGGAQPVVNATPVQTVPAQVVAEPDPVRTESSDSVRILKVDTNSEDENQGAKRKAADDHGEGTSKRRRHTIIVDESADEEVSATFTAHDAAETSPPT